MPCRPNLMGVMCAELNSTGVSFFGHSCSVLPFPLTFEHFFYVSGTAASFTHND